MNFDEKKFGERDLDFDARLDRVLRGQMAEPRAGLEERVLARVTDEGKLHVGARRWWIWSSAAVAVCALVVAVVILRMPHRGMYDPPIAVKPIASTSAPARLDVPLVRREPRKKSQLAKVSETGVTHEVQGDVFFALSPEEVAADKKLVAMLNRPEVARGVTTPVPGFMVSSLELVSFGDVKDAGLSDIAVDMTDSGNEKSTGDKDEQNNEAN
jgi:hypothetical protein